MPWNILKASISKFSLCVSNLIFGKFEELVWLTLEILDENKKKYVWLTLEILDENKKNMSG